MLCRQCLLDESSTVASSLSCPSCNTSIASPSNAVGLEQGQTPRILTRYINEGGIQDDLDIFPLIQEEAYLDADPKARPARAFLAFCKEGDTSNILELLQTYQQVDAEDDEEEDEENMLPADLLRYQDPLNDMKTALHLADENGHQEVVWLLLWLASELPQGAFPQEVVRSAQDIGAARDLPATRPDIRSLQDASGQAAGDLAELIAGPWVSFVMGGIFRY
jgi:hypothetical protein